MSLLSIVGAACYLSICYISVLPSLHFLLRDFMTVGVSAQILHPHPRPQRPQPDPKPKTPEPRTQTPNGCYGWVYRYQGTLLDVLYVRKDDVARTETMNSPHDDMQISAICQFEILVELCRAGINLFSLCSEFIFLIRKKIFRV